MSHIKAWNHIGTYSHHGINLQLSSLHSQHSSGIGEYFDLIPMIDWCASLGFDVIQLLPVNDSSLDPSPYNSISSMALNPAFLSLYKLPSLTKDLIQELSSFKIFNKQKKVPYRDVFLKKIEFLKKYYRQVFAQVAHTKLFTQFMQKNPWLNSYSVFKAIRDLHGYSHWHSWQEPIKTPSQAFIYDYFKTHKEEVTFYIFLQYLCYEQLKSVKTYANKKGVFLKGDIPILISPESVDVWAMRHYFNLEMAAGAPPDVFNPEGQYWGFPLFNWQVLQSDDYNWWKRRLLYAQNFYDLFRIDHIIGFFRIWAIKRGEKAIDGHFEPGDEWAYLHQGTSILTAMINCTNMLPIGEDLGIIPDSVHTKLQELGICSTKVLRWEKYWQTTKTYVPLKKYPKNSLTTVSTHDSETLELWWKKFPRQAKEFCHFHGLSYEQELSSELRRHTLKMAHETPSYFHINLLGEYLGAFEDLKWPNPKDERINIPGYVLPENWTYRIRPSVEELTSHEKLFSYMKEFARFGKNA